VFTDWLSVFVCGWRSLFSETEAGTEAETGTPLAALSSRAALCTCRFQLAEAVIPLRTTRGLCFVAVGR